MSLKASVIIPSKRYEYLKIALQTLSKQSVKPYEVIIVIKGSMIKVEKICSKYPLNCIVIEQEKGFFTHALNIGKKEATGDILIFMDDDAVLPKLWIEKYLKLYSKISEKVAGI